MEKFLYSPIATFIFAVTIVTSFQAFNDPVLRSRFLLNPFSFHRDKNYHTLITSGLIHGDWMHLGFNMLTFWYFAFTLERYMCFAQASYMGENHGFAAWVPRAIGEFKFIFLYVACLILSDLNTIIKHRDNPAYSSLGASGAISGVIISLITFNPTRIEIFGIPGWIFAILYLAGSYYMSRRSSDRINHDAHFWGAAAGLVFTLLLYPKLAVYRFSQIVDFFM